MSPAVSSSPPCAGVDIGGGGVRVRVQLGDRSAERRHSAAVPRHGGFLDVPALCAVILTELDSAMAELGAGRLAGLGIGMTGVPGLVKDPADFHRRLSPQFGLDVLVVSGDAVTTHLGALGGAPGVVVAAGTGVIALGTDHRELWHQVDGWGLLLGDEGSGAWIGQRGLQAALRAADGRAGGSKVLLSWMREEFGEPLDVVDHLYPSESPAHALASFTLAVEHAARDGDELAASIWREAGTRLGQAAVAAVGGLPPHVSWGGGLFRVGDLLVEPFRAEILRAIPGADLRAPKGSALDGALLLGRRALEGAVRPHAPYLYVFDGRSR